MTWSKRKEDVRIATVAAALDQLTVDKLKPLVALLPTTERSTRKGDLVELVKSQLEGENLRQLWEQLDETQKNAVGETLYAADGLFHAGRFRAKYGRSPVFATTPKGSSYSWGYGRTPTLLGLFIYNELVIPDDLQERLKSFVPKPAAVSIKLTDELPATTDMKLYEWDTQANKSVEVIEQIPIIRRDTERDAQQDLITILRLIDKGKVAVSEKTLQASSATMNEIASLLRDGDFYEIKPKEDKWDQQVGAIKAFAWPLLGQAAKLAEPHGKKLALTKAGRGALGKPAHETLRLIWQRWLKSKLLDEFNRVDAIKGQGGKGKRSMTATESRRTVINDALTKCPVGSWVKFDDFGRFMRAAAFDFEVTRNPWELYISDTNYGNLSSNSADWNILEGRYVLCLLFEYAATLGLIDVAYIEPHGARNDFSDLWGVDDLEFLSRYDGLLYFRLNLLGAYCLSLTDKYIPASIEAKAGLTVLPSLQINVNGQLSPDESLLLETYAEKESDTVWHLSREKALAAVESGSLIQKLRDFLAARDEQELPETVEGFLSTTERRTQACKEKGKALLIECASAEIAEQIVTHEKMKKLCLRAGEKNLVVMADAEDQFRKTLRLMGYGMPRV